VAEVNVFRAALGNPNNGNATGPLLTGRREINWDGGGPPVINGTAPVTPFNVFLDTRGAFVHDAWQWVNTSRRYGRLIEP
jgi:hypothetical protein